MERERVAAKWKGEQQTMENRRPNQQDKQRATARSGTDLPKRRRARYRLWALLGLLLLLVVALWFSGALSVLPRTMAGQSLQKRDYEAAWYWVAIANRLSLQNPQNALLAARIARGQGEGDRLVQELANAKRWGADPKAVRREQLLALAQTGQLDDIEAELVALLREGGSEAAEISEAYANGLARLARFDDAVSILDAWRLDFPNDPRPDYRLGRVQEHQQLYDDAEASYRQAISKDAGYFPARYSLGRVLLHQRRAEEAAEQFRTLLNIPFPEAAQVELAIALKALGKSDEARALLSQVVETEPQRLRASYSALDEQPELFKAASEYGKLEADAGSFAEAEKWLTAALEANPQDLMARYALAVSLRGLGRKAEAEEQFARVGTAREAMGKAGALYARIKRDATDVEARFELGKLILEHESERSGLYWIRSVFTYDPHYQPAHELLADFYAARSEKEPDYASLAEHHRKMAQASQTKAATP